jgi:inhibitor of cysteine peptidase
MKKMIAICFVLFVGFLARHSYPQTLPEYSEADEEIKVEVGQDFVITLESNRTTGFTWELAEPLDNNILELLNAEYIKAVARIIGIPGREVWTFKAVRPGKTNISLEYVRPWEQNVVPAKKKIFSVTVKEHSETEESE